MSKVVSKITNKVVMSGTYQECAEWVSSMRFINKALPVCYDILPDWKSWSEEREKIVG